MKVLARGRRILIEGLLLTVIVWPVPLMALEPPPPPKQASGEHRLPKPVPYKILRGEAALPQNIRLGFALDVAGVILSGNWDVSGKVVDRAARRITFVTTRGETGHLVYRVPDGLTVALAVNDPIKITRRVHDYQNVTGFALQTTGRENWVLAAGSIIGDAPHRVLLRNGVNIVQKHGSGESKNIKNESANALPVVLLTDEQAHSLSLNEIKQLHYRDTTYIVLVLDSKHVVSRGLKKSWVYMLDYAVIYR